MQQVLDNTPIIVGIGQITESIPQDITNASSNADLAAQAALIALNDAKDEELASQIDTLITIRTFADSSPMYPAPFGRSNNLPRSIAQRIKANPREAIYANIGGNTPQALVNEFAEKLSDGKAKIVLLTGAEVLANVKAAKKQNVTLDWSEDIEGQLEDRGMSPGNLATVHEMIHQMALPMQYYGLMENARRTEKQMSLEDYKSQMATLFSKFSKVAAANPHATDQQFYTPEEISTPSAKNPVIISPYTKRLIAKERVNQAAAIIMTTVAMAKELGIDSSKWVYLHGYADVQDTYLLERPNISKSAALEQALIGALSNASKKSDEISHFDLYSCFPIVVSEACDVLDIDVDDPRQLTQTGGLPFFGGPGNNYSMHGIISTIETLRSDHGSYGLVLANGGWMSKVSVGIYSTSSVANWQKQESSLLQQHVDNQPKASAELMPNGEATLLSYTAVYYNNYPVKSIVIAELKDSRKRCYATLPSEDVTTAQELIKGDSIGRTIHIAQDPKGNRFAFSKEHLNTHAPKVIDTFQKDYKYCKIEISEWILTVTINRPKVYNALTPMANDELEGIFNAYEKDPNLRVAIITGAGEKAFCTGNDLKYMGAGNPVWIPKTGFGGITSRSHRTKPIISAVNGLALGGGLEIALATDIVVAADHATFGLPEVKVGLFAGAGGIQRLTRQISLKAAMEMMLTGAPISAEKALRLGIINYSVPQEQLMQKTLELANLICQASPEAIRSTMKVYNKTSIYASIDDAVSADHKVFDDLLNSNDFWEGSRSFAEKRKPKWQEKSS